MTETSNLWTLEDRKYRDSMKVAIRGVMSDGLLCLTAANYTGVDLTSDRTVCRTVDALSHTFDQSACTAYVPKYLGIT